MPETTGTLIRKARQRKRMSQEQLAEAIGVRRETVGSWETGLHYPQRYAGLIEELLGITLPEPEPAAS